MNIHIFSIHIYIYIYLFTHIDVYIYIYVHTSHTTSQLPQVGLATRAGTLHSGVLPIFSPQN